MRRFVLHRAGAHLLQHPRRRDDVAGDQVEPGVRDRAHGPPCYAWGYDQSSIDYARSVLAEQQRPFVRKIILDAEERATLAGYLEEAKSDRDRDWPPSRLRPTP